MSYTAPNGDAANFIQTGVAYTAPNGDAANFSWVAGVPTYLFVSKSTVAFRSGSSFALQSASSTYFEHPFRAFSIPSTSAAGFITDQRHFSIDSTSTTLFRPGAQMQVATSSALDFKIQIPVYGTYAATSSTVGAFVGAKRVDAAFSSASSSVFRPGRGYIQPLAFVVRTETTASFRRAYTYNMAFSVASDSTTAFKGTGIKRQQFAITTASEVAGTAKFFVAASTAISASSQTNFIGLKSALTTGAISTQSVAAFASSYTYTPITLPAVDADTTYVTARNKPVFVLTL